MSLTEEPKFKVGDWVELSEIWDQEDGGYKIWSPFFPARIDTQKPSMGTIERYTVEGVMNFSETEGVPIFSKTSQFVFYGNELKLSAPPEEMIP